MAKEDLLVLLKHYDKNDDHQLSKEELDQIILDAKTKPSEVNEEVKRVLLKYDKDGDGKLDTAELENLTTEIEKAQNHYRFFGYSAALARAFRYLAFTSDVGEALRPVASPRVVTGTYVVAFGYCVADVAYETYKVSKTGKNEQGHPTTVMQMAVERSAFQLVASLAGPAVIIHTSVDIAKHVCKKLNRFQKWGPSVFGLLIIPLLPMYLDEPAEKGIEYLFANYGPWANPKKKHE